MAKPDHKAAIGTKAMALAAMAGIAFALPNAVFALGAAGDGDNSNYRDFAQFTPAAVDPALALRVAESIRAKGLDVSFTPAGAANARDKTVTVAIRVNDETARALSAQRATDAVTKSGGLGGISLAPTKYNLGVARGYQTFVKAPAAAKLPSGVRSIEMPDLADFKPSTGSAKDKPSRFKPRLAIENDGNVGRASRTIDSAGDQIVDLGGAYRVTNNLDVTAGVRLSQERDRLDPLTDNVQDSQAVYIGTQLRF